MKLKCEKSWRTGPYQELVITEGTAEIRSGLLDDDESRALAEELRSAAEDLCPLEETV